MNKKEAVAYGQIAFESMMHSGFKGELSVTNFGIEMKQAFKMYPRNIVLEIEACKLLGIGRNLMLKLVHVQGFPAIIFKRKIIINKNLLPKWFDENCGKYGHY